jgi:streptogramin lyase
MMTLQKQDSQRFIMKPGDNGPLRPIDFITAGQKMPDGWTIEDVAMHPDGSVWITLVEQSFTEIA